MYLQFHRQPSRLVWLLGRKQEHLYKMLNPLKMPLLVMLAPDAQIFFMFCFFLEPEATPKHR